MAHKTLISGTAYDITGGKTLVSGTSYSVKNGKVLIGGTAYDISFKKLMGEIYGFPSEVSYVSASRCK